MNVGFSSNVSRETINLKNFHTNCCNRRVLVAKSSDVERKFSKKAMFHVKHCVFLGKSRRICLEITVSKGKMSIKLGFLARFLTNPRLARGFAVKTGAFASGKRVGEIF